MTVLPSPEAPSLPASYAGMRAGGACADLGSWSTGIREVPCPPIASLSPDDLLGSAWKKIPIEGADDILLEELNFRNPGESYESPQPARPAMGPASEIVQRDWLC